MTEIDLKGDLSHALILLAMSCGFHLLAGALASLPVWFEMPLPMSVAIISTGIIAYVASALSMVGVGANVVAILRGQ